MQQLTFNVQRMMSKVLSNTLEPDIFQKKNKNVSTKDIWPECKVCESRYRPIGTLFLIQEYNLLCPIPKQEYKF